MKVTVNAKGEVQLDVSDGDGKAALDLIHQLQTTLVDQRFPVSTPPGHAPPN